MQMPESDHENLDEMLENLDSIEDKYRRALRILLDLRLDKKKHLLASFAKMGGTESYLTSVPLTWISENVQYAKALPVFKKHILEDGRISINDTTRDHLQQRAPDYRRQLSMAMYLATRKYHKFGPLIIVAYKDWIYDKNSDKWGSDGRALESSLSVENLDTNSKLIDLDTANTQYFALDGQHRLMAIKGLKDLLDHRLEAKKQDGISIPSRAVTIDDVEKYYEDHAERLGLDPLGFQGLLDEMMGIEIIPAVQYGESYEEATSRLRNIFVDINENAKRLEKGELTLLDENEGFRIVSRTVLTKHPLFKSGKGLRVNTKTSNVTKASEDYTTLSTIVEISKEYLCYDEKFEAWKNPILGMRDLGCLRPVDEELEEGLLELSEYFSEIQRIPSHKNMIQGTSVKDLRSPEKGDNILFWPIAQVALAKAIADLKVEKGMLLSDLIDVISKYEGNGQLKMTSTEAPWFGILCDPIDKKLRRHKQFQELCMRMFVYLLGGGLQNGERDDLRRDFFNARRVGAGEGEIEWAFDPSGDLQEFENFHLPNPWH